MTEELTRHDIAKILNVTYQKSTQFRFIPKPVRKKGNLRFYDKKAVLAAIAAHRRESTDPVKTICAQRAKSDMLLGFLTGRYDPEEKQKEYEALKFWAREHKPKTNVVRIEGLDMSIID